MSMSVPIAMLAANTSASTQEVPTGVNATVATIYRLMGRAVQPHLKVLLLFCNSSSVLYSLLDKHLSGTVLSVYALWCI